MPVFCAYIFTHFVQETYFNSDGILKPLSLDIHIPAVVGGRKTLFNLSTAPANQRSVACLLLEILVYTIL